MHRCSWHSEPQHTPCLNNDAFSDFFTIFQGTPFCILNLRMRDLVVYSFLRRNILRRKKPRQQTRWFWMLRRFHCGKRSARDYVSFRFGQEIGIAARLRNRRDFSVCSPLSEQSNGRDQWMDGWTDRHHPREQGTRVGGHWWRWRGRRVFTCGLLRVGEWQGSSRPPMANFHHETVDDDDTIELSVEARSGDDAVSFKKSEGSRRRQTIQIPRASQRTS